MDVNVDVDVDVDGLECYFMLDTTRGRLGRVQPWRNGSPRCCQEASRANGRPQGFIML